MAAHLFCFGYGFTGRTLAALVQANGWRVSGTAATAEQVAAMAAAGNDGHLWRAGDAVPAAVAAALKDASHILVAIPPAADGDPVARALGPALANLPALRWLGYLSTTGVYGDRAGGWVDEDTLPAPTSDRGALRLRAEEQWQALARDHGLPLQIFRLPSIYGPGRNALHALQTGKARRITRPGHISSRIHVEDLARVLRASMEKPTPDTIYNVCDDEPAAPAEVVAYAARLLGRPAPPEIPYDSPELSAMARSFYLENKRVRNERLKRDLGVTLRYPSYREGLAALLKTLPNA